MVEVVVVICWWLISIGRVLKFVLLKKVNMVWVMNVAVSMCGMVSMLS